MTSVSSRPLGDPHRAGLVATKPSLIHSSTRRKAGTGSCTHGAQLHHRGVDHAQTAQPVHLQLGVHHGMLTQSIRQVPTGWKMQAPVPRMLRSRSVSFVAMGPSASSPFR